MPETTNGAELDAERALATHLAMLEELQRRLLADMEATKEHFGGHAREAASMARAIVEVSGEIRQVQRAGAKQAEEMSTAEKVDLLVEVFPMLRVDEQKALIAKLRRLVRR